MIIFIYCYTIQFISIVIILLYHSKTNAPITAPARWAWKYKICKRNVLFFPPLILLFHIFREIIFITMYVCLLKKLILRMTNPAFVLRMQLILSSLIHTIFDQIFFIFLNKKLIFKWNFIRFYFGNDKR